MKSLLLICFLSVVTLLNGQIEEGKKSLDLALNKYQIRVVDSLHFYTVQKTKEKSLETLVFRLYDKKFKEIQKHEVDLLKSSYLTDFVLYKGTLVLLNYSPKYGKAQWIKWSTKFNDFTKRSVGFQRDVMIDKICISDVKFLLKGRFEEQRNFIWEGYINSDLSKLERLDYATQSVYLDIYHSDEFDQFYLIDRKGPARNYELRIRVYDRLMKGIQEAKIDSKDAGFILHEPNLRVLNKKDFIISGAYSRPEANGANGYYLGRFDDRNWKFVKLLDFDQFDNFYLAKDSPVILDAKSKKLKRESKGKPFDVSVDLIMHPMVFQDSLVYLFADLFYEKYHTEMVMGMQFGSPVQQAQQVRDGFMFTHAVICGLKINGDKFMDEVCAINLLQPDIKPQTNFVGGKANYLATNWRDKAFFNEIKLNKISESERIEYPWSKRAPVKSYEPRYQHWYDNVYLHHGPRVVREEKKLFNVDQYHIGTVEVE